jgi:hypothetical protein
MSQDVRIYNTEGAVFDEREFSYEELPPISQEVLDTLLEAGGTCDGHPNVRIVSGLDESIVEWYGGRWWRKYALRQHVKNQYDVLHKPDGTKRVLSPQEAKVMGKMKDLKGIIIPVVENNIIEYGIPRYFVEYYKPAELFGTAEAWEKYRWFTGDDGRIIDLMGEFPKDGMYETWFAVEEAILDTSGEVINTRFRYIDDVVLELILSKIEETKEFTQSEQHQNLRKEVNNEYWKKVQQTKEDVKDIVKDHIDRLID